MYQLPELEEQLSAEFQDVDFSCRQDGAAISVNLVKRGKYGTAQWVAVFGPPDTVPYVDRQDYYMRPSGIEKVRGIIAELRDEVERNQAMQDAYSLAQQKNRESAMMQEKERLRREMSMAFTPPPRWDPMWDRTFEYQTFSQASIDPWPSLGPVKESTVAAAVQIQNQMNQAMSAEMERLTSQVLFGGANGGYGGFSRDPASIPTPKKPEKTEPIDLGVPGRRLISFDED